MIQSLGRLLGFTALGLWLDRQPRRVGAMLRLVVVLVAFGVPVVLAAMGRLNYSEVWWWLWIDAFVVGVWTIFALRKDSFAWFFAIHYMGMFTLGSAVLWVLAMAPLLPMETRWWVLVIVGAVSFVLHGWLTRRYWYNPEALGADRPRGGHMVVPYLRLGVVYAGCFIPLSIAGVPGGDDRPISLDDTVRATVILMVAKLVLEVILAVIHLVRSRRRKR